MGAYCVLELTTSLLCAFKSRSVNSMVTRLNDTFSLNSGYLPLLAGKTLTEERQNKSQIFMRDPKVDFGSKVWSTVWSYTFDRKFLI